MTSDASSSDPTPSVPTAAAGAREDGEPGAPPGTASAPTVDTPAATPGSTTVPPADDRVVSVERHGAVAVVVIHRPPHNLLRVPDLRALVDALDASVSWARAAVVASEGRSFCAGADFRAGDAPDPTDRTAFATQTAAFYGEARRLFSCPIPTVVAVHGAAIGAGFGLALACDLRVASHQAFFQANFVQLGIHPGFALSVTVPRLIGPGRTSDLFLTGRRLPGDEAGTIGLVDRVVDPGSERSAALAMASQIAAGAPLAVAATRRTLRHGLAEAAAEAMARELDEQTALAGTADAVEGVRAMLERRPARFEGR